jgi:hypothetical protein
MRIWGILARFGTLCENHQCQIAQLLWKKFKLVITHYNFSKASAIPFSIIIIIYFLVFFYSDGPGQC